MTNLPTMDSDKKSLFGWVAAGILLVGACASILMFDYQESILNERYSRENFCSVHPGDLQSHTVFLLDFSDPVAETDAAKIKESVVSYLQALPVRGKLTTVFINADYPGHKVYTVCRPPAPGIRKKDWECDDPLYGIDAARRTVEDAKRSCAFKKKMEELVDNVVDRSKDKFPTSPLIEVLADVSAQSDFQGIAKKKIILFSDLLQNKNQYSFYRGPAPVAQAVLAKEKIDLVGAEIIVHQIQRKSHHPSFLLKAENFWRELFKLAGAKTDFHSIQ
ncbi:MAG: hypothetical protein OD918_05370 [Gammaproteobacteria bacterium]